MGAGATWFGIYFGIGLILMILTLASHRGRKRAELFEPGGAGDELGAVFLIFVALLWPAWLIAMLTKR